MDSSLRSELQKKGLLRAAVLDFSKLHDYRLQAAVQLDPDG
jgi:hypothetical protein